MNEPAYINDSDAIVWAASDGDYDLVVRLVKAGADVNVKSEDGRAALHVAAEYYSIAEFLLSLGADPNITDSDGDTPYDYAVYHNHTELATLLVQHGATVRKGKSARQQREDDIMDAFDSVDAARRLIADIERKKSNSGA